MRELLSTEELNRLVADKISGTRAEVTLIAQDDAEQVEVLLREYPPSRLWLGPEQIVLDGTLVMNAAHKSMYDNPEAEGVIWLTERTTLTATIYIEYVAPKLEPEQYQVELTSLKESDSPSGVPEGHLSP